MGGKVDFRILGPLEVWASGVQLRLRGPRQAKALAALLLGAGRVVTFAELIEAVWDDPPATARRQIQDLVPSLRRALTDHCGRDVISTERTGYVLHLETDELDAHRFEALVASARETPEPAAAAQLYRSALSLCRGPTLAGMDSHALEPAIARWEEHRRTVWEECLAAELAAGRHDGIVADLRSLVSRNPLRERPVELLMLALWRDDRCSALEVFQQYRRRLAEETGLDPSAKLIDLYQAILRDERPSSIPKVPSPNLTEPSRPAQLPPDVLAFAGRSVELDYLDRLLSTCGERGNAAAIVAVSGTAGVGKTTLALHWAHRVRDRFPDGQLYVNLRGFDPSGQVMRPEEALHRFLEAFGVPATRAPADADALTALYRSQLAGKHVLVVLDNARDADHVRPLLPGTPTAFTIITSRHQLTGLVAAGAHPLTLDVLSANEARELLAGRVGPDRTAAEPDAVDTIAAACAGLPLALAVAAARAQQTGFPLAAIAAELEDATRVLDTLDAGDAPSRVRTVFSWSYDALTPAAARLFRLLALHPGPHTSTAAAASLAGLDLPAARALLGELARANLITEYEPGRYRYHDLLRAYARERAREEPADDRRAALHRMLDHYLHTASAAALEMHPQRDRIALTAPRPGASLVELDGTASATTWMTEERACLLNAVRLAADSGFDTHAWQLAWCLADFLDQRGHWHEWLDVGRRALAAATNLSDHNAQSVIHRHLGRALIHLGRYAEAEHHLIRAADLCAALGERTTAAHTIHSLALLHGRQGRCEQALAYAEHALELFCEVGHLAGQARAYNTIGWYLAERGDLDRAGECCKRSIALHQQTGNRHGEAATWDSLGYVHHRLGDYRRAVADYQRTLDLLTGAADRHLEAMTLVHLGDSYLAMDDEEAARDAWQRALTILDDLHHPDAAGPRSKLAALGTRGRRRQTRPTTRSAGKGP